MKGFGEANFRKKAIRLEDLVPVIPWPETDYERIRLIGPIHAACHIWFTIKTEQKERQPIPKLCLDLDGETDEFTTEICPYRKSGRGREGKFYVVNCIVRSLQQDSEGNIIRFPRATMPATTQHGYKAYWGTKADAKRTPVRIVEISENAAERLVNLKKLNKVRTPDGIVAYEIGDAKHGCDIEIMFDKKKKGAARVDIQKCDRTPITEEERKYIIFPIDLLKPDRLGEAEREMADLLPRIVEDVKKDDAGGDRGGGKRGGKRRDPEPDEDDVTSLSESDLDEDGPDPDIDMEDRPRRGGQPARRGGRSSSQRQRDESLDVDLDSDLDGDLGEGSEAGLDDEYDAPAPRSKRAQPERRASRRELADEEPPFDEDAGDEYGEEGEEGDVGDEEGDIADLDDRPAPRRQERQRTRPAPREEQRRPARRPAPVTRRR